MSGSSSESKNKLAGRGESNTPKFIWYILSRVLCENKLLYGAMWTLLVVNSVLLYLRLLEKCEEVLKVWKPMIDIISSVGAFTAPFIFVVIAVFPSFSEKFRNRLEEISPRNGRPKVQSMLNHFTFVLICSLGMMLVGYLGKYLVEIQTLACTGMSEIKSAIFALIVALVLMLLFATVIELIRSVRTIYIMIIADYTK